MFTHAQAYMSISLLYMIRVCFIWFGVLCRLWTFMILFIFFFKKDICCFSMGANKLVLQPTKRKSVTSAWRLVVETYFQHANLNKNANNLGLLICWCKISSNTNCKNSTYQFEFWILLDNFQELVSEISTKFIDQPTT